MTKEHTQSERDRDRDKTRIEREAQRERKSNTEKNRDRYRDRQTHRTREGLNTIIFHKFIFQHNVVLLHISGKLYSKNLKTKII